MSEDYFTRLGADLAARTRTGAHLPDGRRRTGRVVRRAAGAAVLTVALAATLVGEFPASAQGQAAPPAPHLVVPAA